MTKDVEPKFPTALNIKGDSVMPSYEDYLAGTRQVLALSQLEKQPYLTKVAGHEFIVYPNVFSPKYFNDSDLFAMNLPIRSGDNVLEIGPGTGIVTIMALMRGAACATAIDVNPDAVQNTIENAKRFGMTDRVRVLHGDVYAPLGAGERFDVIFWNTPFGLVNEEDLPMLERAVFDPGYEATRRFVLGAREHLNTGGRVYVGFSSTLGKPEVLRTIASEAGFSLRTVFAAQSSEVHPVMFEIFELWRTPNWYSS